MTPDQPRTDETRRERLIAVLIRESVAQRKRADEWRSIAEYGLHLAMHGERAPGGDETWSEFERRMREQAKADLERSLDATVTEHARARAQASTTSNDLATNESALTTIRPNPQRDVQRRGRADLAQREEPSAQQAGRQLDVLARGVHRSRSHRRGVGLRSPNRGVMTEPRTDEEIRADLKLVAAARSDLLGMCSQEGYESCRRDIVEGSSRLAADVPSLLARLAVVERERDGLRASNHAMIRLIRVHDDAEGRAIDAERERDEARVDVKIRDAEIARQHGIIQQVDAALTEARAENDRLTSELDAARRWQAKRVVAISQDPTCIKWLRESEESEARAVAAEARLEAVKAKADEVHGHGADDLPGEVERLRAIIAEVAALSVPPPQPEPDEGGTEARPVIVDDAGWPSAVVASWCDGRALRDEHGARIIVNTPTGAVNARPGDWIVQGVRGGFYVQPKEATP